MKISVDFANGDIAEYDFSAFTAPDPFRYTVEGERADKNLCTEFRLKTSMLRTGEGLAVDVFFNTLYDRSCLKIDRTAEYMAGFADAGENAASASPARARHGKTKKDEVKYEVDLAVRRVSGVIPLLSKEELKEAEYILVRRCDELAPVAWRQGSKGWLIDGQAWVRASREVYSDAMTTSRNAQELIMVNYLQNAYPSSSLEEICALTGFPVEAYEEIRELEMRNAADVLGDGPVHDELAGADHAAFVAGKEEPPSSAGGDRDAIKPEQAGDPDRPTDDENNDTVMDLDQEFDEDED